MKYILTPEDFRHFAHMYPTEVQTLAVKFNAAMADVALHVHPRHMEPGKMHPCVYAAGVLLLYYKMPGFSRRDSYLKMVYRMLEPYSEWADARY